MWKKIKCLFGWHDWALDTYESDTCYAVGLRCTICKTWHPEKAVRALKELNDEEEHHG